MFSAKKYISRSIFLLISVFSLALILNGCDGGGSSPVSSSISSEPGYKIQLGATADRVSVGGQAVITARIYEPDGSPIRDNEDVMFASSEGGKLSDEKVSTKDGQAMVVFTAGDTPMRFDNISASCRGAIATVQIWVLPQTF
ncbi:MAG: hypothetical protein ACOYXC_15595 [Candidatus Rifleibacteriota bacterium]